MGSLFLRIGVFLNLYFAETNFYDLLKTGYSCCLLFVTIFGKSPLIEITTFMQFLIKMHAIDK